MKKAQKNKKAVWYLNLSSLKQLELAKKYFDDLEKAKLPNLTAEIEFIYDKEHKNKIDINKPDWYEHDKPELKERTKARLQEIINCGMTEVGIASFGYSGVMSGLYIEMVWSYSDEDFNSYMEWAKGLITKSHEETK